LKSEGCPSQSVHHQDEARTGEPKPIDENGIGVNCEIVLMSDWRVGILDTPANE
jgi:hypothetical protein